MALKGVPSFTVCTILLLTGSVFAAVDLVPYVPPDWDDKIVVTNEPNTFHDGDIYAGKICYVHWAVGNAGYSEGGAFYVEIWDDTENVRMWRIPVSGISARQVLYSKVGSELQWSFTTSGTHKLRMEIDSDNNVVESNEGNNAYTKTITVHPSLPAGSLPADLAEVADAQYAPLSGLASGSQEAQTSQAQAVQQLGLPLEVKTRKTGIVFRLVPAGTFMMGSLPSEAGPYHSDIEGPRHQVTLTKPFYCGKFEVTLTEWEYLMGSGFTPPVPPFSEHSALGAIPVTQVDWDACQYFVQQLCAVEGVAVGTYRLLTEAEWEYACRAGTTTAYYFGDNDSALGEYAWYSANVLSPYRDGFLDRLPGEPGGWKKPNAWGLYDMHGNVWEFCQDWLGPYASGAVTDPLGPAESAIGTHVYRGGSWNSPASLCRSATRSGQWPAPGGLDGMGLRIARTTAFSGVPVDPMSVVGTWTVSFPGDHSFPPTISIAFLFDGSFNACSDEPRGIGGRFWGTWTQAGNSVAWNAAEYYEGYDARFTGTLSSVDSMSGTMLYSGGEWSWKATRHP